MKQKRLTLISAVALSLLLASCTTSSDPNPQVPSAPSSNTGSSSSTNSASSSSTTTNKTITVQADSFSVDRSGTNSSIRVIDGSGSYWLNDYEYYLMVNCTIQNHTNSSLLILDSDFRINYNGETLTPSFFKANGISGNSAFLSPNSTSNIFLRFSISESTYDDLNSESSGPVSLKTSIGEHSYQFDYLPTTRQITSKVY